MAQAGPPVRVLVVDDNHVNRMVARGMLDRLGITADTASSGREAVEAVIREPYDLVLMDLHMPDVDGVNATAAIRRHEASTRHTIVIALTASVTSEDRGLCLAAGMDDFLTKPVRIATLADAITRWTSTARDARPPHPEHARDRH